MVENQQLFRALKALLEDFRSELREDEHARLRLQQQYASDKAAWDVEWAVLKCRLEQVPGPRATSLLNTPCVCPLYRIQDGWGRGAGRFSTATPLQGHGKQNRRLPVTCLTTQVPLLTVISSLGARYTFFSSCSIFCPCNFY